MVIFVPVKTFLLLNYSEIVNLNLFWKQKLKTIFEHFSNISRTFLEHFSNVCERMREKKEF